MNISLLVASVGLIGSGGLVALLLSRWPRWAGGVGGGSAAVGCGLGLVSAARVLAGTPCGELRLPWSVPHGDFAIGLDALSAFFLVAIFALCGLAAVYGIEYLRAYRAHRSLGPPWFFFNMLIASMAVVVTARNAVLFLVAWEIMSLASFFLVTLEHEDEDTQRAGWTYLVATHLGTAFLLAMFVLLGKGSGSMDFAQFGAGGAVARAGANLIFVLAVVGFGTKAGFLPLHVWLPEAHPAAPSHVSAVMSGVMIKTGLYGLLRVMTFLGPPPAWWGWLLIGIGLVSGVLGVLFALAQHDLKRLLAYHSVENIGIIALGLGTGSLGLSLQSTPMIVLGFGGGLLHVLNHACFKGLLFLGAGSVLHGTGRREIDRMGGLLKRMPWTGWTFLIGAAAISGLPPLNGFVSELLIYLGALEGMRSASAVHSPLLVAVVAGLALIGGLAVACFAKAFGVVFLGEPRSAEAAGGHECGWLMRLPMLALAGGCAAIGLLGPLATAALVPVIAGVAGVPEDLVGATSAGPRGALIAVTAASIALLALTAGLLILRQRLLAGRVVSRTVTWDCGYARPTARMQYTASSFAQPLTTMFQAFLRTHEKLVPPVGYFPVSATAADAEEGKAIGAVSGTSVSPDPSAERPTRGAAATGTCARLATHTDDVCRENLYAPVFRGIAWGLSRLRWLQHGRVQIYVLYIAATLLALLLWKLN